jgi:hypothetical protein
VEYGNKFFHVLQSIVNTFVVFNVAFDLLKYDKNLRKVNYCTFFSLLNGDYGYLIFSVVFDLLKNTSITKKLRITITGNTFCISANICTESTSCIREVNVEGKAKGAQHSVGYLNSACSAYGAPDYGLQFVWFLPLFSRQKK